VGTWLTISRWLIPVSASLLSVAATTALLSAFEIIVAPDHLIFGYMVPVSFITIRFGNMPAMLTSIVSVVGAAVFLYPPYFAIYVANPLHIAELVFFCLLALAASQIVGKLGEDGRRQKAAHPAALTPAGDLPAH
jgi:K+-sensing histidine kinase KdpD